MSQIIKDEKARNKSIDALKGVGIILMVLGHMHYSALFEKFVFGFHMPLFFCVSGYLYKKPFSLKKYTVRKVQSLLVPYVSFGLLYCIIAGVFYGKSAMITGLGGVFVKTTYDMPIESALWFLLALFWVTVGYAIIDNMFHGDVFKTGVVVIITIIGVYWTTFFHYLPWGINSAMSALGFYAIGVWFRNTGEAGWDNIMKRIHHILKIVGCLFAFIGCGCIIMTNGFLNIRTGTFGFAPIGYTVACIYTLLIYSVIQNCSMRWYLGWLELIGRFSIVYLLTNHPSLEISKKILIVCGMETGQWMEIILEFIIAMILMSIAAFVISKTVLRKIIGMH